MKKEQTVIKFDNIKDLLYHSANTYADNIAFTTKIKNGKEVEYINHTYTNLLEDINYFGTSLYKLGLQGKRSAVVGHNCYEWAVAHLSNLLGGIVSVPLDKGLQIGELEDSLIRSEVESIVFDEKLKDIIEEIKNSGKTNIKHFICFSKLPGFLYFYDLIDDGKKAIEAGYSEYINYKVNPSAMSILLFTSGTTSKSKAVMLNQNGIATNIYDMQLVETFYSTDVNIAFLPYHHIFGSTGMLVMLASGVKTVFPDGLRYIQQNLKEYKVSVFVGVPVLIDKMYSTIMKEVEKQGKTSLINFMIKLSNFLLKLHIDIRRKVFKQLIDALGGNMRFVISGGAPLDKRVGKWFNSIGIHLVQGYGLTETSPVISAENDTCVKEGSVGIPMGSLDVKINNKDANGIGEIIVKGPNVMLGYYKNEEQTNEVLKDGWFHTGDLGYIDDDGYLFITGRQKDLIVLKNGKKVFPEELEILINRLDEVEECFVYGLPDAQDSNDVKVSVEVVYNETVTKSKYPNATEQELKDIIWNEIKEINKTLPMYKYIKHLVLTKEPLIKTTTNKIKRNEELKSMHRVKLADRVLPTYTKGEEIFNMVSHIVGGALGIAVLALCVIFSALHHNVYGIVSTSIYGVSLILLYTMSSIYHGLNPNRTAKKVFQIIDHCSIFILIAGTYTPFALCTLREYDTATGWTLFGIVWGLSILGIVLNSIDLKRYKVFSMICYILLGWCIIFKINVIIELLTMKGFILLLAGGLVYTIGAIFYGLGKKHKWMHSVFHIACIVASTLQFFCIFFYVI